MKKALIEKETTCPSCYGSKEEYREETLHCGGGYFPCDVCSGKGILRTVITISEKEYLEIKRQFEELS